MLNKGWNWKCNTPVLIFYVSYPDMAKSGEICPFDFVPPTNQSFHNVKIGVILKVLIASIIRPKMKKILMKRFWDILSDFLEKSSSATFEYFWWHFLMQNFKNLMNGFLKNSVTDGQKNGLTNRPYFTGPRLKPGIQNYLGC